MTRGKSCGKGRMVAEGKSGLTLSSKRKNPGSPSLEKVLRKKRRDKADHSKDLIKGDKRNGFTSEAE